MLFNFLLPEYRPAIGVCTPLALLTALRVNAPVVGSDDTKLPTMLERPRANISCVALMEVPNAIRSINCYEILSTRLVKYSI